MRQASALLAVFVSRGMLPYLLPYLRVDVSQYMYWSEYLGVI
jgi:hypothetical protein